MTIAIQSSIPENVMLTLVESVAATFAAHAEQLRDLKDDVAVIEGD
jgi:hypothetical protein